LTINMLFQRGARAFRQQWRMSHGLGRWMDSGSQCVFPATLVSGFHSTARMQVVKPVLLADIGEGMFDFLEEKAMETDLLMNYCLRNR
jgi:hypothetical protein